MNLLPIDKFYEGANPQLVIAGPCSAENQKQVRDIATSLSKIDGVSMLRAGVWKPRTRPGNFQGMGETALKWLKEIKGETNLKVTVEVGTPKQAELALKYDIDAVWIGARTTVNPFYVEEIADVLKNEDIIVMVKNPIHPDLSAWVGSIERIYNANIKKIIAIHRGVFSYKEKKFRNSPNWSMALALKQEIPSIPLIVDPSHMAGNINYISDISQHAMDLNFDGLMIETHTCPAEALSDADQQITPDCLKKILSNLIIRKMNPENINILKDLELLREEIDNYDETLIDSISDRMRTVEKIANLKTKTNLSLYQSERWNEIIKNRQSQGIEKGLDKEFISNLFQTIHSESISIQKKLFDQNFLN